MKNRKLIISALLIFVVSFFILYFDIFKLQSVLNISLLSGITPEQAGQVQPLRKNINLKAKKVNNAIELNWSYKNKDKKISYFDVSRSIYESGGWNDPVARIPLVKGQDDYKYIDTTGESNAKYFYQIIGIWVSNGYEVKDEISENVEIVYP